MRVPGSFASKRTRSLVGLHVDDQQVRGTRRTDALKICSGGAELDRDLGRALRQPLARAR
jgi:hypothetical protein